PACHVEASRRPQVAHSRLAALELTARSRSAPLGRRNLPVPFFAACALRLFLYNHDYAKKDRP
ncbi:MAG: hypothetical protein ABJQ72_10000, partial [Nitratireductor sp.]